MLRQRKPRSPRQKKSVRAKAAASGKAKCTIAAGNHDGEDTLNHIWNEAVKLKKAFLTTTSKAVHIMSQIDEDVEWSWAQNDQNKGVLSNMLRELRSTMPSFAKRFASEDHSTFKKQFSKDFLTVELKQFIVTRGLIEDLDKLCNKLQKRHGTE